jgi:tRNA (guanine26-N2/guanine27-N2)-dimethyltransferase
MITEKTKVYREGSVEFHLPETNRIFYNPRARLSRDLGVLAMRVEGEQQERPLEILELMAGVGLRSRRYLAEASVEKILVNDANRDALTVLEQTLSDEPRVELYNELAQRLLSRLYLEDRRFDWVDLDPFGTPAPYFPWVQGVCKWGGLLYVTATDAPVLCGAQRGEAMKTYDAVAYLGKECHEFALRIFVGFLQRRLVQANMHGEPLFSIFDGYSWRVLLRIRKGTRAFNPESLGLIIRMPSGEFRAAHAGMPTPEIHAETDWHSTLRWIGPLWLGRLHEREFVSDMTRAAREDFFEPTRRFLAKVSREADDLPIIYDLSEVADRLEQVVPATQSVIEFLRKQGFRASGVHHNGRAIRTDAPFEILLNAWKS